MAYQYHPQIGPAPLRLGRLRRGKQSAALRAWVFARDGNRCLECGSMEHITLDHIHPAVCGGTDWASNLRTLCQSCNSSRHAKYIKEHGYTFYPFRQSGGR